MSVEYPDDAIPASVPSRRRSVARPETQASWSAFFGKHLFKRSTSIANDKTEHIKRHLQKSAKLEPRLDMGHTPFRITFVGGNKTITQGTAILMILNQLFGGALEEVPQGYLIAGWFPMTFLNFTISSLALTACLMTARVMTMIPGNQFFNQRFEYVATVRHFLGTHVSHIIEVCFHLLICHSLLSFNDAVSAIETFVVRPLYGSTLHFEWDPPGIPRFVSQPLPIDNFINRLQTPPWFTSLSVTGDTRMDTPHTPRIRISVSYILLALVATFLSGRNLDDDPWIQHVAFAFSTSMWLLIMGVCVSRAPVWEIWSKQGLDLLQGVDTHPPAGSSFTAAVKQIYITMSPFRIFGRFCLRKLARLRLGVLRISRLYTDTLGTFTRVAPIVGLLAPSSPTLLAAGRLPGVLGHFPGLSPEYVNPYAFELSRETPVYLTDLLKDQQVFVIPDVTPLNADYSIYNLTAFSLAADIRRHSRRRLLSTKAHSHTPHAPHSFDDWILANQCGTCYDDLCWDYLEHSSLLVCPTPEWATRWQSHTVRRYIETRYAEKRDEPPLIPHTLRTHTRNHFALLAVFVRLWSVTDMVPSLVNEMRTEVDVAQTFFSAFWIGGAGILILTFTVAAAFPGLSAFQGVSPVTLITDSALPQMLSNILLCSYAIFTILPHILLTCVTFRYNLVNTGKLTNRQATFLCCVFPFLILWIFDGSDQLVFTLDLLVVACTVLCYFLTPYLCYLAAFKTSPLAIRDEVRNDYLRMSISAFKPRHGTMSHVQHTLQKWAKYAGRRDLQLKILLKSQSPSERLLAVACSQRFRSTTNTSFQQSPKHTISVTSTLHRIANLSIPVQSNSQCNLRLTRATTLPYLREQEEGISCCDTDSSKAFSDSPALRLRTSITAEEKAQERLARLNLFLLEDNNLLSPSREISTLAAWHDLDPASTDSTPDFVRELRDKFSIQDLLDDYKATSVFTSGFRSISDNPDHHPNEAQTVDMHVMQRLESTLGDESYQEDNDVEDDEASVYKRLTSGTDRRSSSSSTSLATSFCKPRGRANVKFVSPSAASNTKSTSLSTSETRSLHPRVQFAFEEDASPAKSTVANRDSHSESHDGDQGSSDNSRYKQTRTLHPTAMISASAPPTLCTFLEFQHNFKGVSRELPSLEHEHRQALTPFERRVIGLPPPSLSTTSLESSGSDTGFVFSPRPTPRGPQESDPFATPRPRRTFKLKTVQPLKGVAQLKQDRFHLLQAPDETPARQKVLLKQSPTLPRPTKPDSDISDPPPPVQLPSAVPPRRKLSSMRDVGISPAPHAVKVPKLDSTPSPTNSAAVIGGCRTRRSTWARQVNISPNMASQQSPRLPSQQTPRLTSQQFSCLTSQQFPCLTSHQSPRFTTQQSPRFTTPEDPRVTSQQSPRVTIQQSPRARTQQAPRFTSQQSVCVTSRQSPRQISPRFSPRQPLRSTNSILKNPISQLSSKGSKITFASEEKPPRITTTEKETSTSVRFSRTLSSSAAVVMSERAERGGSGVASQMSPRVPALKHFKRAFTEDPSYRAHPETQDGLKKLRPRVTMAEPPKRMDAVLTAGVPFERRKKLATMRVPQVVKQMQTSSLDETAERLSARVDAAVFLPESTSVLTGGDCVAPRSLEPSLLPSNTIDPETGRHISKHKTVKLFPSVKLMSQDLMLSPIEKSRNLAKAPVCGPSRMGDWSGFLSGLDQLRKRAAASFDRQVENDLKEFISGCPPDIENPVTGGARRDGRQPTGAFGRRNMLALTPRTLPRKSTPLPDLKDVPEKLPPEPRTTKKSRKKMKKPRSITDPTQMASTMSPSGLSLLYEDQSQMRGNAAKLDDRILESLRSQATQKFKVITTTTSPPIVRNRSATTLHRSDESSDSVEGPGGAVVTLNTEHMRRLALLTLETPRTRGTDPAFPEDNPAEVAERYNANIQPSPMRKRLMRRSSDLVPRPTAECSPRLLTEFDHASQSTKPSPDAPAIHHVPRKLRFRPSVSSSPPGSNAMSFTPPRVMDALKRSDSAVILNRGSCSNSVASAIDGEVPQWVKTLTKSLTNNLQRNIGRNWSAFSKLRSPRGGVYRQFSSLRSEDPYDYWSEGVIDNETWSSSLSSESSLTEFSSDSSSDTEHVPPDAISLRSNAPSENKVLSSGSVLGGPDHEDILSDGKTAHKHGKVELKRSKVIRIEVFNIDFLRKHHLEFTQVLILALLCIPGLIFVWEILTKRLDYIVPPMNLSIDASELYMQWHDHEMKCYTFEDLLFPP